jgi:hypothetical protein
MARLSSSVRLPALLAASLVLCAQARAEEVPAPGTREPPARDAFDAFVSPLRAEAGPVLSLAVDPVPANRIWASAGVRYASQEEGRATYSVLQSAVVLGGEWSPEKVERLGIGADLVAFQTTTLMADLPPVIHEERTMYDLGPLRLRAKVRALEARRETPVKRYRFELALTPFFSLGLPTDTSRIREERRMPVRGIVDDRVFEGPHFLIEPGAALGMSLGVFAFYAHQGALFAPIHGEDKTHFYYAMHYGLAARIAEVVELAAELNGLLRFTRDYNEQRLFPWAFSPGVRLLHGQMAYELSARIGLNDDAYDPYGDFTLALAVAWRP